MKRASKWGGGDTEVTPSVSTSTSVLVNAVAAFDSELTRFAKSVVADVRAVTSALAEPPASLAAIDIPPSSSSEGDAAAPFLNMLTHATEDVEDTIESIGRIAGVTVPRAQQLVSAALDVYRQQGEAILELERMLQDLGIPLPPSLKRSRTLHSEGSHAVTTSTSEVPSVSTVTTVGNLEHEDDYRQSQTSRAGQSSTFSRISVDTTTGRVSVSHRLVPDAGNDDEDNLDYSMDGEEPTVLSLQPNKPRSQSQIQIQPEGATRNAPLGAPAGEDEESDKRKPETIEKKENEKGQLVQLFTSMEELTAKAPKFLINTSSLEDINGCIAALNKVYSEQQQEGKACQLTNEEVYAIIGDERLLINIFELPTSHLHYFWESFVCAITLNSI